MSGVVGCAVSQRCQAAQHPLHADSGWRVPRSLLCVGRIKYAYSALHNVQSLVHPLTSARDCTYLFTFSHLPIYSSQPTQPVNRAKWASPRADDLSFRRRLWIAERIDRYCAQWATISPWMWSPHRWNGVPAASYTAGRQSTLPWRPFTSHTQWCRFISHTAQWCQFTCHTLASICQSYNDVQCPFISLTSSIYQSYIGVNLPVIHRIPFMHHSIVQSHSGFHLPVM